MERKIVAFEVFQDTWEKTREAYIRWDRLNEALLALDSRIMNFPSIISELAACYFFGYKHMLVGSSGDAYDEKNDLVVEIKATSNYDSDLSSFSPSEWYDKLIFVRHSKRDKTLSLYDTRMSRDDVDNIQVNRLETYKDHREAGRRPRFSIIKEIINKNNLEPDFVVDMETGRILKGE